MQTLTAGVPGKVILKFSLPIFIGYILQQVYQLVDNIIVGQFLGANAFAAVGSTYGIFFLLSGLVWGITAGFTVLAAQNLGAGKGNRIRQGVKASIYIMAVYFLIFGTLIAFLGKNLTYLFISESSVQLVEVDFSPLSELLRRFKNHEQNYREKIFFLAFHIIQSPSNNLFFLSQFLYLIICKQKGLPQAK